MLYSKVFLSYLGSFNQYSAQVTYNLAKNQTILLININFKKISKAAFLFGNTAHIII
jgi:hypothetical protein